MSKRRPREDAEALTSMDVWLPVVEKLGIRSPKTIIVEGGHMDMATLCAWYDHKDDSVLITRRKALITNTREAMAEIGMPCFLRTAFTSNKHEWDRTCYCTDPAKVGQHIMARGEVSFYWPGRWAGEIFIPA